MLTKKNLNSTILFILLFLGMHAFCSAMPAANTPVQTDQNTINKDAFLSTLNPDAKAQHEVVMDQDCGVGYFRNLLAALKNVTYQTDRVVISLPNVAQHELVIDLSCSGSGDLLMPLPALRVFGRQSTKTLIGDEWTEFLVEFGRSVLKDQAFEKFKASPLAEKLSKLQSPEVLFLIKFALLCADQSKTKPAQMGVAHDYNFYNEVFRLLFRLSDAKIVSLDIKDKLSSYLSAEVREWVNAKYPRVFNFIDDVWACLRNNKTAQTNQDIVKNSVLPVCVNMLMFNDSVLADKIFNLYNTDKSPNFMDKTQEDIMSLSSKYSFLACEDILELTADVVNNSVQENTKENGFGAIVSPTKFLIGTKTGAFESVKNQFAVVLPTLASEVGKITQFPTTIQLKDIYNRSWVIQVAHGFDAFETAKLCLTKFITVLRTYQKERHASMLKNVSSSENAKTNNESPAEKVEANLLKKDHEKLALEIFELENQLKNDVKCKFDKVYADNIKAQILEKQGKMHSVTKQIDTQWFSKFVGYVFQMNPEIQTFFNDIALNNANVVLRDDLAEALSFIIQNSQFIQANKETYSCAVNFLGKKAQLPEFWISVLKK